MSLRPKSCDHEGQSYIGTFLSIPYYPLSRGQHALDDPKLMKEHTQIPIIYEYV